MASWDEFEKRGGEQPAQLDAYAGLCAAVFTSVSGAELLKVMRARTIEYRAPIGATEAVLREIEAQRRFVADLERARDRGLKLLADKAKPKS